MWGSMWRQLCLIAAATNAPAPIESGRLDYSELCFCFLCFMYHTEMTGMDDDWELNTVTMH